MPGLYDTLVGHYAIIWPTDVLGVNYDHQILFESSALAAYKASPATFLSAGEASLATRPVQAGELESDRLKARLGEMLLERELLEAKIVILEGGRPLVRRRSRR